MTGDRGATLFHHPTQDLGAFDVASVNTIVVAASTILVASTPSYLMPPRSRYAVDPSLTAQAQQQQQWQPQQVPDPTFSPGFGQQQQQPGNFQQPQLQPQQQPYVHPRGPQLHNVDDHRAPAPTGPYAPQMPDYQQQQQQHHQQTQPQHPQQPQQPVQYNYPPQNHIAPPPHSAGPQLTGPRIRIDPSQLPDPVEAQELDQNLYDDEDFMSCDTKGLIPLAVTDYRGIDQG